MSLEGLKERQRLRCFHPPEGDEQSIFGQLWEKRMNSTTLSHFFPTVLPTEVTQGCRIDSLFFFKLLISLGLGVRVFCLIQSSEVI